MKLLLLVLCGLTACLAESVPELAIDPPMIVDPEPEIAVDPVPVSPLQPMIGKCPLSICSCPVPNGKGIISLQMNGTNPCFCNCGYSEGEACDNTDQCEKGTECSAPKDFSHMLDKTKGICTSKCEITRCPQFHKCQMLDDQVNCVCATFRCSDRTVNPVSAVRQSHEGFAFTQIFNNICEMVNANCDLTKKKTSQGELWRLEHNHSGGSHKGGH